MTEIINRTDPDLLLAINEIKDAIKDLKSEPVTQEHDWTEAELDAVSFPCDDNNHIPGFILGLMLGALIGFMCVYYGVGGK